MTMAILVLVVEDEPLIQDVVESPLRDGGYEVAKVGTGEQAIEMLEARISEFRALVTDVNLGRNRLTGWDVARRARELNPTIPVIYMTGDGGGDWAANGVPNSVLVTKPFAPAQVVTAISQLLNDSAPPPAGPDGRSA